MILRKMFSCLAIAATMTLAISSGPAVAAGAPDLITRMNGEHIGSLFDDKAVMAAAKPLLDDLPGILNEYFQSGLQGAGGGSEIIEGSWIVGYSCAQHLCSIQESFAAFDTKTGNILLGMLSDDIVWVDGAVDAPPAVIETMKAWNTAAGALAESKR